MMDSGKRAALSSANYLRLDRPSTASLRRHRLAHDLGYSAVLRNSAPLMIHPHNFGKAVYLRVLFAAASALSPEFFKARK